MQASIEVTNPPASKAFSNKTTTTTAAPQNLHSTPNLNSKQGDLAPGTSKAATLAGTTRISIIYVEDVTAAAETQRTGAPRGWALRVGTQKFNMLLVDHSLT